MPDVRTFVLIGRELRSGDIDQVESSVGTRLEALSQEPHPQPQRFESLKMRVMQQRPHPAVGGGIELGDERLAAGIDGGDQVGRDEAIQICLEVVDRLGRRLLGRARRVLHDLLE